MKEWITLSSREMQRCSVLQKVADRALTLKAGAILMKLGYRQAKRAWARFRREGPKGLAHQGRGRQASNAYGHKIRDQVLALSKDRYAQFNDTHFVEMLKEREGLRIGRETVRGWRREAGIEPKRRRRPPHHHQRRPRRPVMGLLVQWDGSPHRWFGPDHPPCSLLHATDDATNTVLGMLFRPQEDAIGYLRLLDMILRRHGVPVAIYQDRHSALYRNDPHWSHEEELAGVRFPTHVGRVLQELAIEAIPAFSPQAKGRIERQGGTLQDRLIAELALAGITDIETANGWLETTFLARFNARFAKSPEQPGCAFRKIKTADRYHKIAFAYQATVANDNSVRLGGLIIDIQPGPQRRSYAHRKALVRQHLDGAWTVWLDGLCRARHSATALHEPVRTWKPRERGDDPRARHLLQIYLETTPAPLEGDFYARQLRGHLDSA
jgi:transposase